MKTIKHIETKKRKREPDDVSNQSEKKLCMEKSSSSGLKNYESLIATTLSQRDLCCRSIATIVIAQRRESMKTQELRSSNDFFCQTHLYCENFIKMLSEPIIDVNNILKQCKQLVLKCVSEREFLTQFAAQYKEKTVVPQINEAFKNFKQEYLFFILENTYKKEEIITVGRACLSYGEIPLAIKSFKRVSNSNEDNSEEYLADCTKISGIINEYIKIFKNQFRKDVDPLLKQYLEDIVKILQKSISSDHSDSEKNEATQEVMDRDATSEDKTTQEDLPQENIESQ